jgi:hypothetical protein
MPVTEGLQQLGRWSLTLKSDTPKFIRDAISTPWQHIIITPSWVDVAGMSDDDILDNAMYCGVVLRPGPQYELGGVGNLWWLGDERGVPHLTTPVSSGTGSSPLSTWVTSLLALTPIGVGSVTGAGPVGGNVRAAFRYESARTALEAVFKYFQVEYRMTTGFDLDYGEPADLYGTDPVATALPKGQGGREFNLKGFQVTDLDYSQDFTDFLSHVTAAGRGGNGTATGLVPTTDFEAYDPIGGNIVRRAFFDVPEAALGFETNYAESIIARYSDVDYVGVSTDDFVRDTFGPGYYINVYDSDRGLLDADNQDVFQGEVLFPKLVRVIGMTWPIQEGVGVYYRHTTAQIPSPAWSYVDLTPYVEWERPGTRIDTGNPAYSPINEQFSSSAQTAPVLAGTWDTYTPTWSSSGVQPTLNNGTIVGYFRRQGTTLHLRGRLICGSGTAFGSGEWRVSLPPGMDTAGSTSEYQVGRGMAVDTGTASYGIYPVSDPATSTTALRLFYESTAGSQQASVTATTPHAWANTDVLAWNITMEVDP